MTGQFGTIRSPACDITLDDREVNFPILPTNRVQFTTLSKVENGFGVVTFQLRL
jgi:hypothetical protein